MPRTIERCRRIIDAVDEGICSIDAEGRTSFVNPRLTEMSGFHAEEVLGRPVFDLVDQQWHPTVREALENTRHGIRGQHELELCRKDRTKVWISFIASPLYDRGSYVGCVALIEDISARKQTQRALRLSEERFRLAITASSQGLWDWDVVADRAYLGSEYLSLIGYAEEIVQPALAWFNDIVHPEDRPVVTETMAAHLEGKTPQSSIEYRMRRSTGEYLWVRGVGRVVERTESGAPLRMMGIVTDISQQKKTEAELERARRTESELRAELEQVTQAAHTVSHAVASLPKPDVSAVLTTLALQAQALTGAKYAATGIGTDPEEPFEPWVSVGISPQVVQALGHPPRPIGVLGEVARGERVTRVPELRRHTAFRSLPPGHPEITSFLGVPLRFGGQPLGNLYLANKQGAAEFSSEDERKVEMLAMRAAIAVQTARLYASEAEKRAWLGTTIDQIPEGIVLVGRDGRLVIMNRAAGAFICGEARGLDPYGNPVLFDLRSPHGAPLPFDDYPIVRALRWGEVTLGRQLLVRIADGRMLPILSNAAPVYDERGEIAGATNLIQDITPLKELERLREEWSSVVVHDLKQPVNVMSLEVEALLRSIDRPERLQQGLERIQRSVARLDRMIGDLLSASLLEAHRLPLERQVVDLASLVNGAVDRLRSTVTGHRMEVVAEEKQSAWVDPDRTQQVLENLISNAAKYAQHDSAIRVASVAHDDLVELTVTNWGPGIQPEELSTLFSRFRRTARARDAKIPGLGLGLYIVKGLVEAQGGRVWAESVPGGATSFHFTLPRNPQQSGGHRMG